jgi:Cu(I)/Ag(I) efflux system membrane protein CusA/SilA
MVETMVLLRPRSEWARVPVKRFWSDVTPDALAPAMRALFPDSRQRTYEELVRAMGDRVRLPGFTTALTMPVRTRIDMLTTGIRTPLGVKVLGDDPALIEETARAVEAALRAAPGVRSAVAERAASGSYLDVTPRRADLARYGLTNQDVTMMLEASVGGLDATTLIDGRRRIGVVVRASRDARLDVAAVRELPIMVRTTSTGTSLRTVPLASVADVRTVTAPTMLKSENGRLAAYVYVDVDLDQHDLRSVARDVRARLDRDVPAVSGIELVISGQLEQLEETRARLAYLVPLTLVLVVLLLYAHLGNAIETLIVLATVPFSLVGSVWALYLLDYHVSTAVWVGVVALVGLAAQTGVVMVMYLDQAYLKRLAEGRINSLEDIIDAHREGTVLRVRPKLMTVATAMIGLLPLLFADGLGADVMKRIAAPMVGGLVTSAFLTLEILPVIYTYWRHAELRARKREAAAALPTVT